MRKIPALFVVAGLLASLTACSTAAAPGSAGCLTPVSGDASSVVTASKNVGSEPKVTFPTPIVTKETQVSVVKEGHGPALTTGTPVLIKYTIYSGATAKVLSSSSYGAPTTPITVGSATAGAIGKALECSQVGSRLAIAVKDSELTSATAKPTKASEPADIVVLDVVKSFLPKANGALQRGVSNMPAVVTAADGAPGLSFPSVDAPDKRVVQVIRQGKGHELTADDTVVTKFTAVDWATKPTVQGSTWTGQGGNSATTIPLNSSQIPAEVRTSLIGQRVGSQVMVVIPPSAASGQTQTIVYVFDVLGSL